MGKGIFTLSNANKGYNKLVKSPNFNGSVPDRKLNIGAHETAKPPMEFGPIAYLTKKSKEGV